MERTKEVDPNLIAYLKDCLKLNDTERFLMTTKLYKIKKMMDKAVITHKTSVAR